ncbi:MAG: type IV pilin protein [Candidatus Sumerlaeaceae bacterium]
MVRRHKYSRAGFTLIELLIVVAIIAILAAIAVPNFLEAQVRSKVSRCKADMRSIATAIESYVVDNNKYPDASFARITGVFNNRLLNVTTPVAYMSSYPVDTFRLKRTKFPDSGSPNTSTFDYTDRQTAIDPLSPNDGFNLFTLDIAFTQYFDANASTAWFMNSPGPDFNNAPFDTGTPIPLFTTRRRVLESYDATNGTTSRGAVWRTNAVFDK